MTDSDTGEIVLLAATTGTVELTITAPLTPSPTVDPTPSPTAEPTVEPTPSPTALPSTGKGAGEPGSSSLAWLLLGGAVLAMTGFISGWRRQHSR